MKRLMILLAVLGLCGTAWGQGLRRVTPPTTYLGQQVKTVGTGGQYPTLAAAISAAVSGDTILLLPGTYSLTSGVTLPSGVNLMGLDRRTTVIQSPASNTSFIVVTATKNNTIRGVDIYRRSDPSAPQSVSGSAVKVIGSGVRIENSRLGGGADTLIIDGASATIANWDANGKTWVLYNDFYEPESDVILIQGAGFIGGSYSAGREPTQEIHYNRITGTVHSGGAVLYTYVSTFGDVSRSHINYTHNYDYRVQDSGATAGLQGHRFQSATKNMGTSYGVPNIFLSHNISRCTMAKVGDSWAGIVATKPVNLVVDNSEFIVDGTYAATSYTFLGGSLAGDVRGSITVRSTPINGTSLIGGASQFPITVDQRKTLGTVASGKATAYDYGTGLANKTVLTFTLTGDNDLDLADGNHGGGVKVFDFPAGRILVLGATINASAAYTGTNGNYYLGVGTATAADDADLTDTEQDIVPKSTIDGSAESPETWTAALAASAQFDGTSTATALYVNVACPDASNTAAQTYAITGTATVHWINLGDY